MRKNGVFAFLAVLAVGVGPVYADTKHRMAGGPNSVVTITLGDPDETGRRTGETDDGGICSLMRSEDAGIFKVYSLIIVYKWDGEIHWLSFLWYEYEGTFRVWEEFDPITGDRSGEKGRIVSAK